VPGSRQTGYPRRYRRRHDSTASRRKDFDWIWLLKCVADRRCRAGRFAGNPKWRAEFQAILPHLTEDDICGSGFAITAYTVNNALGGERR